MRKSILVFLLFFKIIVVTNGAPQEPPIIDTSLIRQQVSVLVEDPSIIDWGPRFLKSFLIVNDSLAYFQPTGTLHLFEITFGDYTQIQRLSKSRFHGNTFNRYLFLHKGEVYMIGGSGMFGFQSELLKFHENAREWHHVNIKGSPINKFRVATSWSVGDQLFVVYGLKDQKETMSFGVVDLNTFTYEEISRFPRKAVEMAYYRHHEIVYRGNNFSIMLNEVDNYCRYDLFNLKTGVFFKSFFFKEKPCMDGYSFPFVKDSTLYFRYSDGRIDSAKISTTAFDQVSFYDMLKNAGSYGTLPKSGKRNWIGAIIIAFLGSAGFFYFKKARKQAVPAEKLHDFEAQLLLRKGETLPLEEINVILGISHLSSDTMKMRRSNLIRDINKRGKIKITRVRTIEDRRIFDYKIEG